MDELQLLRWSLVALGAALTLTLTLFLAHGAWRAVRERWLAPRRAHAIEALRRSLEHEEPDPEDVHAITRLPPTVRIELLASLAPNLAGSPRERLSGLAARVGAISRAERRCRSRRWPRRLRAVRVLERLGGGAESVPPLLDDRRPAIRAQAAEWAGEHGDAAAIERLAMMAGEVEALPRFAARDALIRARGRATGTLERVIRDDSDEVAVGALTVAAHLAVPELGAAALERVADPDPRIRAGAARVLGATGTKAGTDALEALLGDAEEVVRAAAAGALGRLGAWSSGARLVEGLGDPSWVVRRQSALALRALDQVGEVLLRSALRAEDRFARDMAAHTLGLPEAPRPG